MKRWFLIPAFAAAALAQSSYILGVDDAVIGYNNSQDLEDPVARLQRRIDRGEAKLQWEDAHGYLASVLKHLGVPVSSQMLVYSKTSFQLQRITPQTPRAVYFSDDVYVGWVQDGDVVEISSVDPRKGGIFYTLDQAPADKPKLIRRDECLQCHASPKTQGVPGHMVRSVYTATDGYPVFQAGGFVTNHASPMKERWGGWYVSGTHTNDLHMGNSFLREKNPEALDLTQGANVMDLSKRVDLRPYLTPHSDIVALMVLEHQAHLHNLITRANYEARIALEVQASMDKALGRSGEWTDSTKRRVFGPAETMLQYLLFSDEVPLKGKVQGTSQFTKEFAKQGPRDRKGRSLRDLDLEKRLFRYPASFLIYSDAFQQLPPAVKEHAYKRLYEVLSGKDASKAFAHLSAADRQAIREILLDTKPDFQRFWEQRERAGTTLAERN
ncbi:MAG: hypothetical protein ACKV22_19335 [Bryobacteraceae bacterium]